MERHPQTGSLWALRSDRLVEISKSGTRVERNDGRCIPAGTALCPSCSWAPSGLPCRPCSQADTNSMAWIAKCKLKEASCTASARRLLSEAVNTTILFTLKGNFSIIKSIWQGAVASTGPVYNITVSTADPIGEMRRIRERLALIVRDVQAVVQPYERILIADNLIVTDESTAETASSGASSVLVIAIGVSGAAVAILVITLVILYVVYGKSHHYSPVPHAAPKQLMPLFAGVVYHTVCRDLAGNVLCYRRYPLPLQ